MDERQYLSLRRLPEYSSRDQRSEDQGSRMNPFTYVRAEDANQAVTAVSGKPQSKFLGGGTNLIDLMKMGVETPNGLIDVNRMPLAQNEELPNKGVPIGAMSRSPDVAEQQVIKPPYRNLIKAPLS